MTGIIGSFSSAVHETLGLGKDQLEICQMALRAAVAYVRGLAVLRLGFFHICMTS